MKRANLVLAGLALVAGLAVAGVAALLSGPGPEPGDVFAPLEPELSAPQPTAAGALAAASRPDARSDARAPVAVDARSGAEPRDADPRAASPTYPSGVRYAPIGGQVWDPLLDVPVPGAQVKLRGFLGHDVVLGQDGLTSRWLKESVLADAQGRFLSTASFPAGTVRATVTLGGERLATENDERVHLEDTPGRAPWRIVLRRGPSFRLAVHGVEASDPGDWRGRVVLRDANGKRTDKWSWNTLEAGDPLLLRYTRERDAPAPGHLPWLEVESLDGVWSGAVRAQTTNGLHPGVIVVPVSLSGSLAVGRVVGDHGGPLFDVHMTLRRPDGEVRRANEPKHWSTDTDASGEYRFERLPEGRFELVARPNFAGSTKLEVEVVPGMNTLPDIEFGPLAGNLEGVLRAADGRELPRAVVKLQHLQGLVPEQVRYLDENENVYPRREIEQHAVLGLDLGWRKEFTFVRLDPGRYRLRVEPADGASFTPIEREVDVAGAPLEIVVEDAPPVERHVLRIVDRATGEPHSAQVWITTPAAFGTPERAARGEYAFSAPAGEKFSWVVLSEDHRPAHGDHSAFARADEEGVLVVYLDAGWGGALAFRSGEKTVRGLPWSSTATALSGVAVWADDSLVATSGADGVAIVSLAAEPKSFRAELPGWRPASGGALKKRIRGLKPHSAVVLKPE